MPDDKEMVTASLSFIERIMTPLQSAVMSLTESQRELVTQQKAITGLFQSRPTRLDLKDAFEGCIDDHRKELIATIDKHNGNCAERHAQAKPLHDRLAAVDFTEMAKKISGIDSKLFKFMAAVSVGSALILGIGISLYREINILANIIQAIHPSLPK